MVIIVLVLMLVGLCCDNGNGDGEGVVFYIILKIQGVMLYFAVG